METHLEHLGTLCFSTSTLAVEWVRPVSVLFEKHPTIARVKQQHENPPKIWLNEIAISKTILRGKEYIACVGKKVSVTQLRLMEKHCPAELVSLFTVVRCLPKRDELSSALRTSIQFYTKQTEHANCRLGQNGVAVQFGTKSLSWRAFCHAEN